MQRKSSSEGPERRRKMRKKTERHGELQRKTERLGKVQRMSGSEYFRCAQWSRSRIESVDLRV